MERLSPVIEIGEGMTLDDYVLKQEKVGMRPDSQVLEQ